MIKEELIEVFKKIGIPFSEGVTNLDNNDAIPKIVYWDYLWKDISASGERFNTIVTYQVSFRSIKPRDEHLIQLKKELANIGLRPEIAHEYILDKREWHSYFSIDIFENLDV